MNQGILPKEYCKRCGADKQHFTCEKCLYGPCGGGCPNLIDTAKVEMCAACTISGKACKICGFRKAVTKNGICAICDYQ